MGTDRPSSNGNGNGHDPEVEEGGSGALPRDVLDDGEDVTFVSDRELILRAVNASLVAKAIGQKVDDALKAIAEVDAKVEAMSDLLVQVLAIRSTGE
jgi:hypothetical protein